MRTVTTSRTRLAAALTGAIVVGAVIGAFAGPPVAGAARSAFSGTDIKKHSIPGNRLKKNTLTGRQIKESTLGVVPKASSLTPLHWNALHPIVLNGWHAGTRTSTPQITKDGQGIVYMRGAATSDLQDPDAFVIAKRFRPSAPVYVPIALGGGYIGQITIETNGTVTIDKPRADTTKTLQQVYLGAVSYAAH